MKSAEYIEEGKSEPKSEKLEMNHQQQQPKQAGTSVGGQQILQSERSFLTEEPGNTDQVQVVMEEVVRQLLALQPHQQTQPLREEAKTGQAGQTPPVKEMSGGLKLTEGDQHTTLQQILRRENENTSRMRKSPNLSPRNRSWISKF